MHVIFIESPLHQRSNYYFKLNPKRDVEQSNII